MNKRHPNHDIACSKGGHTAATKVYYCERCDKVGQGHKMTHGHLRNNCHGKASSTLVRTDKLNRHRIDEARLNTKEWYVKEQLRIEKAMYASIKADLLQRLAELQEISRQSFNEVFNSIFENEEERKTK